MSMPASKKDLRNLALAFLAGLCLASLVVFLSGVMIEMKLNDQQRAVDPLRQASPKEERKGGRMDPHEMAMELRKGGYILYFRHPERQKWDSVIAFDVWEAATGEDASAQGYRDAVCLTPRGKEEARMIGMVLRASKIPVGTVVASPICRARQTAELAFGRIDAMHRSLIHTPVVNKANAAEFKDDLRNLLRSIPVGATNNAVISAHENTIRNHPDLFASGTELLKDPIVLETGLYVLKREASGALHVVQKYMSLGDLAANGIQLSTKGPNPGMAGDAGATPQAR